MSRWPFKSVEERFASKYVVEPSGCWRWVGGKQPNGYGRFGIRSCDKHRMALAHRVSYELWVGPIPDGMTIDHLCRQRDCVNPSHMEVVTRAENTRRGSYNLGKTKCKHGHSLDEANTYYWRNRRACRKCRHKRRKESYDRCKANAI